MLVWTPAFFRGGSANIAEIVPPPIYSTSIMARLWEIWAMEVRFEPDDAKVRLR